jgi:hypothetical protein
MSARTDLVSIANVEEREGVICIHCWHCRRFGWLFPQQLTMRVTATTPVSQLRLKCQQCGRYADRRRIFFPAVVR